MIASVAGRGGANERDMGSVAEFARPELQGLRACVPDWHGVRVKLDSNESPFDLPACIKENALRKLREIPFNRYPQGLAAKLRETIAFRDGVSETQVTLGNGLDEVIYIILQAFGPGRKVIIQKPSFTTYTYAALSASADIRAVPLDEGLRLSTAGLIEEANAAESPCILIICNPHNPTGGRFMEEDIVDVLEATNSMVIVDEAYVEFSGGSVLPLVAEYDRLIVLRTLSKAFGLAGVRVGYSVSSSEIAAELDRVRQPFNLDSLALVVAQTALENDSYCREAVIRIVEERERLLGRLGEIHGVTCFPSCTNFILFRTTMPDATMVRDALRRYGVSVRVFPDEPMLRGCLRVSCGTKEEDDAFLEALEKVLAEANQTSAGLRDDDGKRIEGGE